jgi:hypothetical protein
MNETGSISLTRKFEYIDIDSSDEGNSVEWQSQSALENENERSDRGNSQEKRNDRDDSTKEEEGMEVERKDGRERERERERERGRWREMREEARRRAVPALREGKFKFSLKRGRG